MKILVTGSAGFIGSNLVDFLLRAQPDIQIVSLDKLTYAGNRANLSDADKDSRHEFVQGDIGNRELVSSLFDRHQFQGVYHLAAESHVDNSISNPGVFVETNVLGTFNLLDCARAAWMEKPAVMKAEFENARFVHVSTDEVYGALGDEGAFTETTPYAPNSPYSASKAGSDFLARAYFHTYGFNVVTTNCSNNYGPKQHREKLIPTVIRKALDGQKIPIYGNGKNVRDWLYVMDHCAALVAVFNSGRSGETYNVGTRNERRNIDLAHEICGILNSLVPNKSIGDYNSLITFVEDRAGHDHRYAIDPQKIESEIGWKPAESFESGLLQTVRWYLESESWK